MAAKNKFASVNYNHVYEKTTTTSSSTNPAKIQPPPSSSPSSHSAASYSAISSPNKPHGRMLVLTRSTSKPVVASAQPSSSPQSQQHQYQQPKQNQQGPDQPKSQPGSDGNEISLRPLGHTGTGSSLSSTVFNCEKDVDVSPLLVSLKPGKFVPPHLRPGFVPKEEKIRPNAVPSRHQGHSELPERYGEDARPKSGGYEGMRRGGVLDMGMPRRPPSSGSRPGSSG